MRAKDRRGPAVESRAEVRLPRHLLALGALLTVLSAAVAWFALDAMPHVTDEVAYTLQARLFAAGLRTGPALEPVELARLPFWNSAPRSFAVFPPGWPALLAPGEALGLGWLVNPLLAGALPPLLWLLAREWVKDHVASLAALVVVISPGVWVLAASRMSHTSVLVALLGASLVVQRGRDGPGAWLGAALGLAYVVLARPFDAVLLGGPLIALGLWRAPSHLSRALLVALPGLAASLVLLDNHGLTGDALTFPVSAWFDDLSARSGRPPGCNRLGFGAEVGCLPWNGGWGYTVADAAAQTLDRLTRLDKLLLGFHGGSLVVLVGVFAMRRRGPLLLAAALWVVAGYALYWSPGLAYGARFLHPATIVLAVLLAAGAWRLVGRLAWLVLPAVVAGGSVHIVADLSSDYWCADRRLAQELDRRGITEGVLFLQILGERPAAWPSLDSELTCDAAMEAMDAAWLIDPVHTTEGLQPRLAPESGADANEVLDQYFPEKPAWLVQHDVVTDRLTLIEIR